jgi:O-antigen ligase/tetratricopeptide (TPR) repeat protein
MASTIDGESAHAPTALAADVPDRQPASAEASAPGRVAESPGDVVQAWLCLLPALALAWPGPGALLRDDFVPQSTGIGAAALLSIPAIAWLIARKAAPAVRGLALFLAPLLVSVGWISFGGVGDTFEAARTLLFAITGLVMLLCGASLGPSGRRTLARGAVCVSLALLVPAHFDRDGGWSGLLGNTGSTSEAALAGAVAGACLLADETNVWRVLGGAALGLELAYVARVPVIAGALSLGGALACVALFARDLERRWRVTFAAFACAAVLGVLVPVLRAPQPSESKAAASVVDPGNTGGVEVRARIWRASLGLFGGHALFGVGPGQFAVWFPAHRDPREIELSTLSRRTSTETEVEHPHNDWLAVWLETGVIGGACWLAFATLVIASALRSMRAGGAGMIPLAAAALALLANAFVNATLSGDALSSTLACAMFGSLLAQPGARTAPLARRFVVVCTAALLLVHAPRALALVRHGRALHALAARKAPDATDASGVERALEKALDACPDSVLALSLRARSLEAAHAAPAAIQAAWARVLAARPQRIEALMQLGRSLAVAGAFERARPCYLAALELDRSNPGVLQNLATLELEAGEIAQGLAYLDELERVRPPPARELADFAATLYLRGLEAESDALMARAEPQLTGLSAESAYAEAKAYRRDSRNAVADGLESRAHRTWAREHMRAGRFADAVRSYRQDLRIARDYAVGGPLRVRLELAAALLAAGRESEARQEITGLEPSARDWAALPDLARERLRATGWFPK